jgi:hypothetical protein
MVASPADLLALPVELPVGAVCVIVARFPDVTLLPSPMP